MNSDNVQECYSGGMASVLHAQGMTLFEYKPKLRSRMGSIDRSILQLPTWPVLRCIRTFRPQNEGT